MKQVKLPTFFLSHESPLLWDTPSPAQEFLKQLGRNLPQPRGILLVSAHWQESMFTFSSAKNPSTIHDFGGFPPHYHEVHYPAIGLPSLAVQAQQLLLNRGIEAAVDPGRGMDHAVWLPLGLMYQEAQVPIVSMSIKRRGKPQEYYEAGQALLELREQGILIIASGTATHNLGAFFSGEAISLSGEPDPKAQAFSQWLKDHANQAEQIINYRKAAPYASHCHPTPDHFVPFIVALGAGGNSAVTCIHESFNYSHFAMMSFRWG